MSRASSLGGAAAKAESDGFWSLSANDADGAEPDEEAEHPGYGSLLSLSGSIRKKKPVIELSEELAESAAHVMELSALQQMQNPERPTQQGFAVLGLDALGADEDDAFEAEAPLDDDPEDDGWDLEEAVAHGATLEEDDWGIEEAVAIADLPAEDDAWSPEEATAQDLPGRVVLPEAPMAFAPAEIEANFADEDEGFADYSPELPAQFTEADFEQSGAIAAGPAADEEWEWVGEAASETEPEPEPVREPAVDEEPEAEWAFEGAANSFDPFGRAPDFIGVERIVAPRPIEPESQRHTLRARFVQEKAPRRSIWPRLRVWVRRCHRLAIRLLG